MPATEHIVEQRTTTAMLDSSWLFLDYSSSTRSRSSHTSTTHDNTKTAGFAVRTYLDSSGGMIEADTSSHDPKPSKSLPETKFDTDSVSLHIMGGSWRLVFALLVASIAGKS